MADNNQNNQFTVTTSLISLFDENGNQLRLNGLENGLSIAIWVPAVSPDGRRTYPVPQRINTILNPVSAAMFGQTLAKDFVPCFEDGKNCVRGIHTNMNRTNMVALEINNGDIFLKIYKDINQDNVAKDIYSFKFSKTPLVKDYDGVSGQFEVEYIDAQFYLFVETVRAYTMIGEMAGHSNRVANKFTISSFYQYVQAIAAKLGVVVQNQYQHTGGQGGNYQGQNNAPVPAPGGYTGQVNEVDDINALLG